jgi:hypothetical protein
MYEKLPIWLANFKVNLETIGFKYTLTDLPKINGSALCIDKPMSSTRFYQEIEHIKDYKGTIICCDRALAQVIEHRLPNYVTQVDASYLIQYFFDLPKVKAVMDKITAVFATTTHPLTIRLWGGRRVYFTPWMGYPLTDTLVAKSKTVYMSVLGCVHNTSWLLALNLGANPIALFGTPNAYDSLAETEYPEVRHRKVRNQYGTFYTDPVYDHYNQILLACIKYAKEKHGIETINCSQQGILYSPYVTDMSLEEFVRRYQ